MRGRVKVYDISWDYNHILKLLVELVFKLLVELVLKLLVELVP